MKKTVALLVAAALSSTSIPAFAQEWHQGPASGPESHGQGDRHGPPQGDYDDDQRRPDDHSGYSDQGRSGDQGRYSDRGRPDDHGGYGERPHQSLVCWQTGG